MIHFQNEPIFPEEIQRFGCRFFSLLAIPQLYIPGELKAEEILDIYRMAKLEPAIMGANCLMGKDEHKVIDWAFRFLGRPWLRGAQVGRMKNTQPILWGWVPKGCAWQYMICHWDTGGRDGHWTLWNREGREIYDPHDPALSVGHVIKKKKVDKRLLYYVWEATA